MPPKCKRPCAKVGCINLVVHERYCPRHDNTARPQGFQKEGTTTQRGYGWQWQKKRLLVLSDPDHAFCRIANVCVKRYGHTRPSTHVDHIIPTAAGGSDDWENLQGSCADCNEEKGRTTDKALIAEYQRKAPKT